MRRAPTWRVLVAVLAVAALAAACGSDGGSGSGDPPPTTQAAGAGAGGGPRPAPQPLAQPASVTIGTPGALEVFSTVYLADAMGEFEAENLDVTIVELRPNDAYVSMSQGQLDVYVAGVNAGFINLVQSGVDLRWVANTHTSAPTSEEGLWVRNELLDGTRLKADVTDRLPTAMGAGGLASASIVPVEGWLRQQGKTLDDLEVSTLSGNDIVVALETGAIDAGYLPSPGYQVIAASGCCTLVTPKPPFAAATYAMSDRFIEGEPEVAKAVVRALARTNRTYLQGDYHADDQVVRTMSEVFKLPVETIRKTPSLVFDPDLGLDVQAIDQLQRLWIGAGVLELDQPVPVAELTDPSVVQQALAGS